MGKVDGYPGNCSRKKRGLCEVHQEVCPKHTNWAYMKSKSCEICAQEERAQERFVLPQYCIIDSFTNHRQGGKERETRRGEWDCQAEGRHHDHTQQVRQDLGGYIYIDPYIYTYAQKN